MDENKSDGPGPLGLELSGSYEQNEAFIHVDGQDYYIFAKKSFGHTDIQIKLLQSLADLPAVLPEEVPVDIYVRLEKKTRGKRGWIRQSL